jgi:hypothetical protein
LVLDDGPPVAGPSRSLSPDPGFIVGKLAIDIQKCSIPRMARVKDSRSMGVTT